MLYEIQNNTFCTAFSSSKNKDKPNASKENLLTDKVLWNDFKRGDEAAFEKIYKNYSTLLFDCGCKYSSDKEMVRDCLQDFFLYLKKNKSGFGDTTSIKLYLLKAFKRRIVEYLKRNKVAFTLKEPSEYSHLNVESSIEAVYISKQINAEQQEKLHKALNALDSKERKAIHCFYFQGLSYEQIAEILNFTHVSSARRVMYRSLRHMRDFFKN